MRKRVSATTYTENEAGASLTNTDYDYGTLYTYDVHGNVYTLVNDYRKLAISNGLFTPQRYKTIHYNFDLVSGKVNSVSYQDGAPDAFYHRYQYDADNRIDNVLTSRDKLIWNADARYYYYLHGPLRRTEIGDSKVQGIDYAYTLQGWIKGVNSATLQPNRDIGKDGFVGTPVARDAFGYTLSYFEEDPWAHKPDYNPINNVKDKDINGSAGNTEAFDVRMTGSDLVAARNDLYNGNIGAMVTAITKPTDYTSQATAQAQTPLPQGTAYTYDQLNRLLTQKAYTNISNTNTWQATGAYNNNYYMKLDYDAMGNIEHLDRYDQYANGVATKFDQQTYRYDNRDVTYAKKQYGTTNVEQKKFNNRLYLVNDAMLSTANGSDIDDQGIFTPSASGNPPVGNYEYDEIGNLIKDKAEEIAEIKWNVYGKIASIKRTVTGAKPNLRFEYDASGNRVAKLIYINNNLSDPFGSLEKATYYMRDAQGNVMATYDETFINNDINYRECKVDCVNCYLESAPFIKDN